MDDQDKLIRATPHVERVPPRACGRCSWWDDLSGQTGVAAQLPPMQAGICRRHSPFALQPLSDELEARTQVSGVRPALWPITRGADWCGDFRTQRST